MDATEYTIDNEIKRVLDELALITDITSDKYAKVLQHYRDLVEIRNKQKFRINPDIVVTAITNILGIFMILQHEKFDVISSKAIGFIRRS